MLTIKNRFKEQDVFYNVLAFVLLFFGSNTLYTQIYISTEISSYLVFAISVALYMWKFLRDKSVDKNSFVYAIVLSLLVVVSLAKNLDVDNMNGYLIIIMKITGSFFLLNTLDLQRFFRAFFNIVFLLAVSSLIVTYVFPIFSLDELLPVAVNRMGIRFYNGFLTFKVVSYGTFGLRNYGIFSEPAVFCFYLFLGALFGIYDKTITVKKYICAAIIVGAMITTFSPIGIITAASVLLTYTFYYILQYKNTKYLAVPAISVLTIVLFFALQDDLNYGFSFMLSKFSLYSGNGLGRLTSVYVNMREWLNFPVFGGGLKTSSDIATWYGFNTSTTGTMFSAFGVVFAVPVTYLQIMTMGVIFKRRGVVLATIFAIVFILQINNHGLIQGDWYWFATMIGATKNKYEAFDNNMQPGKLAI